MIFLTTGCEIARFQNVKKILSLFSTSFFSNAIFLFSSLSIICIYSIFNYCSPSVLPSLSPSFPLPPTALVLFSPLLSAKHSSLLLTHLALFHHSYFPVSLFISFFHSAIIACNTWSLMEVNLKRQ